MLYANLNTGGVCKGLSNSGTASSPYPKSIALTLLSHIGKLYERIVERRLRDKVESKLGKWQHGFRPGKSTIDLIFAMKMMCEKNWEWNKEVYACFIDLEKAFDRVDRSKLWEVLRKPEYDIDPKLIRVIMSIYKITNSKVKSRDIESEWFRIGSGVRQGGVLSPLLFIIFMDSCLKEICTTDETTFARRSSHNNKHKQVTGSNRQEE